MNVKKWNEYQQAQDTLIKSCLRRFLYWFLGFINPLFKKKNRILFYDYSGLQDSNLTLALFLKENRNYKIYSYSFYNIAAKERYDGIIYFSGIFKLIYFCLTSRVIVETHTQQIKFHPTDNQLVLMLWHGNPIKKSAHLLSKNPKQNLGWYFTKICYSSVYFKEIIRTMLGGREDQMFLNGYPRTDLFYQTDHKADIACEEYLKGYKKAIIWMPTYRNSNSINLGGRFKEDFPILNSENIEQLNQYLKDRDTLLVIKLHPLQNEVKGIQWEHSNIRRVNNAFFSEKKIQFYYFLNKMDALITDYSSIEFEYILKDKPMGFAIDDIGSYKEKNGFSLDNLDKIFCGPKIYNFDDLCQFIDDVYNEKDKYINERKYVKSISDDYCDGNNCRRLAELIDKYLS